MCKRNRISKWFILLSLVLIVFVSCKKWADAGLPPDQLVAPKVYGNDSLATAALNDLYTEIVFSSGLLNGNTTKWAGLYGDELNKAIPGNDEPFVTNTIASDDLKIQALWANSYKLIYIANDVIAGISNSTSLGEATRDQLTGEALFLRSLVYFYLTNLFGDVPFVTGIDYKKNAVLPRTPVAAIYAQLVTDLQNAENKLSDTYISRKDYPMERVRANKKSATALRARIHLYLRQWSSAEAAATTVIVSPLYQLEADVQQTFRLASREAILQFLPVSPIYNTAEGSFFVPAAPTGKPAITLTDTIVKSFEPADKRWNWIRQWIGGSPTLYSPYKYKIFSKGQDDPYEEYSVVLRVAEQYLIRAEARMMQNNLQGAADDINVIRQRAGIKALPVFDSIAAAMTALQAERCRELFAEWGQRWFDLNRWPSISPAYSSKADEIMSQLKPRTWKSTDSVWPIPYQEIQLNNALQQNPGY